MAGLNNFIVGSSPSCLVPAVGCLGQVGSAKSLSLAEEWLGGLHVRGMLPAELIAIYRN